eukprot:1638637-Pyramimonas_sp.AAC.1
MLGESWCGPLSEGGWPPKATASRSRRLANRRLRLATCRQVELDWSVQCQQQPWWGLPWTEIYQEATWPAAGRESEQRPTPEEPNVISYSAGNGGNFCSGSFKKRGQWEQDIISYSAGNDSNL